MTKQTSVSLNASHAWPDDPAPAAPARLVSVSTRVNPIRPEQFLRRAKGAERFFWREADAAQTLAGMGIAAEIFAWGQSRFADVETQTRALFANAILDEPAPAPALMGGFAFRDDFVPDNTWAAFHPAHFVLPHLQLTEGAGGETWLTLNALAAPDEPIRELRGSLKQALAARAAWLMAHDEADAAAIPENAQTEITYPMSLASWTVMLHEAIRRIQSGELKKVVLARMCELRGKQPLDVDRAMAFLNDHYAGCYRFLFEPRPGHAFLGATPELLARVNGRELRTMALAGSQKRGRTAEEDAALERDFLSNAKELHEHALVADMLRERLEPHVRELDMPDAPETLKLSNIMHLHTPVQAELNEASGVLPMVALLHPTPALGGSPRETALEFIRENEPITRGWYAAPIGVLHAGADGALDGAFAVAIRSAVAQHERAWLYAGCGVVGQSIPQNEWAETALKFKPMLNAFGS